MNSLLCCSCSWIWTLTSSLILIRAFRFAWAVAIVFYLLLHVCCVVNIYITPPQLVLPSPSTSSSEFALLFITLESLRTSRRKCVSERDIFSDSLWSCSSIADNGSTFPFMSLVIVVVLLLLPKTFFSILHINGWEDWRGDWIQLGQSSVSSLIYQQCHHHFVMGHFASFITKFSLN